MEQHHPITAEPISLARAQEALFASTLLLQKNWIWVLHNDVTESRVWLTLKFQQYECVVLVELYLGSEDLRNCSVFSKYSTPFCVLDTTQIGVVINVPHSSCSSMWWRTIQLAEQHSITCTSQSIQQTSLSLMEQEGKSRARQAPEPSPFVWTWCSKSLCIIKLNIGDLR